MPKPPRGTERGRDPAGTSRRLGVWPLSRRRGGEGEGEEAQRGKGKRLKGKGEMEAGNGRGGEEEEKCPTSSAASSENASTSRARVLPIHTPVAPVLSHDGAQPA